MLNGAYTTHPLVRESPEKKIKALVNDGRKKFVTARDFNLSQILIYTRMDSGIVLVKQCGASTKQKNKKILTEKKIIYKKERSWRRGVGIRYDDERQPPRKKCY